jgi:flagellar biosynthesis protein FlhB
MQKQNSFSSWARLLGSYVDGQRTGSYSSHFYCFQIVNILEIVVTDTTINVIAVIIIIIIIISFFGRNCYLIADSVYITFVGYNLKVSRCHRIYNCRLIINVSHRILGTFIICLRAKFHVSNYRASLVIVWPHCCFTLYKERTSKDAHFSKMLPYIVS